MMELHERIELAIQQSGKSRSEIADEAGITQSALSQILTGKTKDLKAKNAISLSKATGVRIEWLVDESGPMRDLARVPGVLTTKDDVAPYIAHGINEDNAIPVPVLANAASMGVGSELLNEDVVAGTLLLTRSFVLHRVQPSSPSALRFLHAYGDSMSPTLNSGDIVLVDTGATAIDIDGVYVLEAHGRLFIKRVRQRLDGSYEISSDNPAHKTVDVLDGSHEVRVIGRVLWAWNGRKM